MYNPPTYLSLELVAEIVSEYQWPAPYELEDELPDCVAMCFPSSTLLFVEGFESVMDLQFTVEDTGTAYNLGFTHALMALYPLAERGGSPLTLGLIMDDPPGASLHKVANGIRDLCTIALTHLQPVILGDFSWVAKYQAQAAEERRALSHHRTNE